MFVQSLGKNPTQSVVYSIHVDSPGLSVYTIGQTLLNGGVRSRPGLRDSPVIVTALSRLGRGWVVWPV